MSIELNKKKEFRQQQRKKKERIVCAHSLVRKENNKSRFYKSSRREYSTSVFYASERIQGVCIWIFIFQKKRIIDRIDVPIQKK